MTKIKMLNDRIIFDGHADSRQECETITLMCDNLAQSKDFKTIRYESGYAEFEKVGKTEELKFAVPAKGTVTVVFDSHITKVENSYGSVTTSGNTLSTSDAVNPETFTVTLEDGYVINTVVLDNSDAEAYGSLGSIGETSFTVYPGYGAIGGTITITSKIPAAKQTIDVSTLSGWANLATGNHQITIKTKASGYVDSAASNAVTVSKAASGGHKLTLQYIKQAPPSTEGEAYGGFGYYVNNGDKQDIATEGTTIVQNCNTVKIHTYYTSPDSTLPTPEWVYNANSFTITLNGQSVSEDTLLTLTQDSTIIVTETAAYVDYNNECIPKCCFVAGTKVKTPNGEQPIETLKAGDYITTYNEETKQYEPNKVLRKLINRNVTELATLKLNNGKTLQFNAYHPLLTENGYKSLTCHNDLPLLTKEDKLIGGITIEEIVVENLENPIAAYNLLVENNNNFIVNGVIALGKDDQPLNNAVKTEYK